MQKGCYLETFSEQNVRFYRRHGFEITGSGDDLIPGGPPLVYGLAARMCGVKRTRHFKLLRPFDRASDKPAS